MAAGADNCSVRELQRLRVAPPVGSVPAATLPLSFFDVQWLPVPPVQNVFFYDLPVSSAQFQDSHLPAFADALSLALQIFFPLAGGLTVDDSGDDVLSYADGDGVSLMLAECAADFEHLSGDHRKYADELHPFVQPLAADDGRGKKPVLALQLTVFPGSGICLGLTLNHAAADGRSFLNFVKSWAAISKSGAGSAAATAVKNLPLFDRVILGDLHQLKRDFLDEIKTLLQGRDKPAAEPGQHGRAIRVTCALTRSDVEKIRRRATSSGRAAGPRPSTFVVVTGFIWTCVAKSRGTPEGKMAHFGFAADCRDRLRPPVPEAYFGNCVAAVFAEVSAAELVGEEGIAAAVEAINRGIGKLGEEGPLKGASEGVIKFMELAAADGILSVAGSPRMRFYETDFGWGPPRKVEIISIEETGAFSLVESRWDGAGVEIGLLASETEVEPMVRFLRESLKDI